MNKREHWDQAWFWPCKSGSAVGLGNIWCPHMAGENGGAAFIIYLICILLAGFDCYRRVCYWQKNTT